MTSSINKSQYAIFINSPRSKHEDISTLWKILELYYGTGTIDSVYQGRNGATVIFNDPRHIFKMLKMRPANLKHYSIFLHNMHSKTSLFVKNIKNTEHIVFELKEIFDKCGVVLQIKYNATLHLASVFMDKNSSCLRAIEEINGIPINGQCLNIELHDENCLTMRMQESEERTRKKKRSTHNNKITQDAPLNKSTHPSQKRDKMDMSLDEICSEAREP